MARRHLAFLLCLSLFVLPAQAQFRAGLQGTVEDATGAVISGATVAVTNQETNASREVASGDTGFYRVSSLPAGRYTVKVSSSGFKEKVVKDVIVTAEETRGLDITLEPGAAAETVEVTAEAGGLHTENAEITGTLSTREVQRLPQVGRDPYELVRLAPGVFGLGARNGSGGGQGFPGRASAAEGGGNIFATENRPEVSAAGQRVESNNIQIDGVTAMSQAWSGSAIVTPNQESVKEVRVLANNYTAEFGRNTGAQVQIVSQTGTNAFHGSMFFKRNSPGLNSEQDFVRAGTAIREDPQLVNRLLSQWGGSIGGPILKNKLFFFFSYDTIRQEQRRLGGEWVETPEYASAVSSQGAPIARTLFNLPGISPLRIVSVDSRTCASAGFNNPLECTMLPGGLDIGSINPLAIPGVLQPGIGGGLDGIPDIQFAQLDILDPGGKDQQFNARVDYQVTKNDLVAFSTYWVPSDRDFTWGGRGRPAFDFTSARRNTVATLLWTRTLSPTLLNEARFNVTRWFFDEIASNPDVGWGIPKGIVCFNPGCFDFGGQRVGPGVFFQTTYNFRDTVSKVVNAHSLKFGVDFISEQNNDRAPWAGRPTYWFGNPWSFANDAPHEQVAFFDPQTGAFTDLSEYYRYKYYALF
ncbi:MAG: carboxypeptidase regulatory-like domain-containing protein, partial [Terriglobales bacterium]